MLPDAWAKLLHLVGDDVVVLHAPWEDTQLSGGDLDCAVIGYDPSWPIRLGNDWRLYQCIHYDFRGWYFVLESADGVVALDLLDDPRGLGRDGFPTAMLRNTHSLVPSPAVRAAYLTAKRIRKRMLDEPEWRHIGELSRHDVGAFLSALTIVLGPRLSNRLSSLAVEGQAPSTTLMRRAHRIQRARRVRSPSRLTQAAFLGALRRFEAIVLPTGMFVLVTSPDKQRALVISELLPDACVRLFRRNATFPWRRPTPGRFRRHGRVVSSALLANYCARFLIDWARFLRVRAKTGLVIMSRGWWDIARDPRACGLDVAPVVAGFLERVLPRPYLTIAIEARSVDDHVEEAIGRRSAGRLPGGTRVVHLDDRHSNYVLSRMARDAIAETLEERARARTLQSRRTSTARAAMTESSASNRTRCWSFRPRMRLSTDSAQGPARSARLFALTRTVQKLDAAPAADSLQSYLVTSAYSLLPADRDRGAMIRGRIIRRLER